MDQVEIVVQADHCQEENTRKHVQLGNEGISLAKPQAKRPVETQGHIGDIQGQEENKNEVCNGQIEEPESSNCLLPLKSHEPNDNGISWNSQNKC